MTETDTPGRYAYAEIRVTRTYRVRVNMDTDQARASASDYGGAGGPVLDAIEGLDFDALEQVGEDRVDDRVLAEDGPLSAHNHMHHPDDRPFVVLVTGPEATIVPADRVADIREIFKAVGAEVLGTWNEGCSEMSVSVVKYLTLDQLAGVNEALLAIDPVRTWRKQHSNGVDRRPEFDGAPVLDVPRPTEVGDLSDGEADALARVFGRSQTDAPT